MSENLAKISYGLISDGLESRPDLISRLEEHTYEVSIVWHYYSQFRQVGLAVFAAGVIREERLRPNTLGIGYSEEGDTSVFVWSKSKKEKQLPAAIYTEEAENEAIDDYLLDKFGQPNVSLGSLALAGVDEIPTYATDLYRASRGIAQGNSTDGLLVSELGPEDMSIMDKAS